MSLVSFAKRRIATARSDDGFTLVEILAAIVVFALAAAMGLAMLLAAVRGGYVAKMDTVGRNLSQAKVEELRNLPYHIDQAVSTEPDLLDLYYPNRSGTGAPTGTTGYVPSGATTRSASDGDPATGAFFRTVINPVPNFSRYKQYVTLQFINASGIAVSPQSAYSASTVGADTPITNQVNVTVTTFWNVGKSAKKYNIFTSVSGGRPLTPRVSVQGHVGGVNVTGLLPGGLQGTLDLADLDYNASFSNIVAASATALAARAKVEGGASVTGALTSVNAPPNTAASPGSGGNQTLQYNGEPFAQFAGTDTNNISAGSASGQPYAGTSALPLTDDVLSNGGDGSNAALYTNQSSSNSHLGISDNSWLVRVLDNSAGAPAITASAYGNSTTSASAHQATSNVTGLTTARIELFPTTYAPDGVVQLKVTSASLNCTTGASFGSGATSTASTSLSYTATLRYATWSGSSVTYNSFALGSTNSVDPLQTSLHIPLGLDNSGVTVYLDEYIASWSSLTSTQIGVPPAVQQSSDNKSISANYSGLISVNTQPVRSTDPTSGIGVTVGALSCLAEDFR